ncbi:MAG: hypothetical protein LBE89_04700 [Helicobacteraceae bacterium]|jgi:hypothetical protein|nr:hypothetical protein [Helicobacteraceae bacterium]
MTTTWIRPVHKSKGKSVVRTLIDTIGYTDNPEKSNNFEYVKSYGCDYFTAVKENNIDTYDDLKRRASAASGEFRRTNNKLREIEAKLKSIAELQKQIGVYGKTRSAYGAYIKSGKDPVFYEANRADIVLCQTAKRYFNEQGHKDKLPSINRGCRTGVTQANRVGR